MLDDSLRWNNEFCKIGQSKATVFLLLLSVRMNVISFDIFHKQQIYFSKTFDLCEFAEQIATSLVHGNCKNKKPLTPFIRRCCVNYGSVDGWVITNKEKERNLHLHCLLSNRELLCGITNFCECTTAKPTCEYCFSASRRWIVECAVQSPPTE